MVLELKVPLGANLGSLKPIIPVFIAYAISFSIIGIYWNNHHHLLRAVRHISPGVMWANLHLLFWLSLIPFMTAWMGEHYTAALPTSLYAVLFLICGSAYQILLHTIIEQSDNRALVRQFSRDYKGYLSLICYVAAVPLAFVSHWLADTLFLAVSILWTIPDRRLTAPTNASH
jgi:uncharacterized membrane protein